MYPRETFLPWRWSLMILRYVHSRSDHVKGKTDSTFQTACKVNYPPGFSRVWQLRRACHDGLSFAVRDRSSLAPHCDVCSVGSSQSSRVAILPQAIYKHKYLRRNTLLRIHGFLWVEGVYRFDCGVLDLGLHGPLLLKKNNAKCNIWKFKNPEKDHVRRVWCILPIC
jgi:hypothetical protein